MTVKVLPLALLAVLISTSTALASDLDTLWIDVRTPAEYASGHIKDAVNIEFQDIGAKIAAVTSDKDSDIRLYCRSGRRSGVAKQTLVELGYTNVHNEGGYAAALAKHVREAGSDSQ